MIKEAHLMMSGALKKWVIVIKTGLDLLKISKRLMNGIKKELS